MIGASDFAPIRPWSIQASRSRFIPPKNPPPSIAISRNGKVRSFKMRPVVAGSSAWLLRPSLTAYVGATAYLVYRDDLLGAAVSRQVAMQYAYEERIAALRSELDRVSSRHLIQTESVETQLGVLLERQARSSGAPIRARRACPAGRARQASTVADAATRMPRARPDAPPRVRKLRTRRSPMRRRRRQSTT